MHRDGDDDRLLHDPQAAGSDDPWIGGTRHDAEEALVMMPCHAMSPPFAGRTRDRVG